MAKKLTPNYMLILTSILGQTWFRCTFYLDDLVHFKLFRKSLTLLCTTIHVLLFDEMNTDNNTNTVC